MSRIEGLEERVHGRSRNQGSDDELRLGVVRQAVFARNEPGIQGAQWTGIVTQVGRESGAWMLTDGWCVVDGCAVLAQCLFLKLFRATCS